jgi:hypothetical protein
MYHVGSQGRKYIIRVKWQYNRGFFLWKNFHQFIGVIEANN